MAKLNGDFGGNFSAETIFDSLEEVDITGKITKVKIPIKEIITKLLHEYAGEPYHNIIIEDLQTMDILF
jgi:tryptophan synthase beta subunit